MACAGQHLLRTRYAERTSPAYLSYPRPPRRTGGNRSTCIAGDDIFNDLVEFSTARLTVIPESGAGDGRGLASAENEVRDVVKELNAILQACSSVTGQLRPTAGDTPPSIQPVGNWGGRIRRGTWMGAVQKQGLEAGRGLRGGWPERMTGSEERTTELGEKMPNPRVLGGTRRLTQRTT